VVAAFKGLQGLGQQGFVFGEEGGGVRHGASRGKGQAQAHGCATARGGFTL
jgi:hypothetical protein